MDCAIVMKLLVIEDSERLRRSLGRGLKKVGYAVDLVGDGRDGLDYARFNDYEVIVLDLMLPTMDGLTVLERLRDMGDQTHILILSAKDQVEDRIRGLRMGADDYMVKPFAFDELCARIESLRRRRYERKSPEIWIDEVVVKTAARKVEVRGEPVEMTRAEYAILECLAQNRGRVISKEALLDAIHDSESVAGTNVIEVMICHLRKKLPGEGTDSLIKTRRGFGYCIE